MTSAFTSESSDVTAYVHLEALDLLPGRAVLPPSMPGRRWLYSPYQRNRPRRPPGSMEPKPREEYTSMIRWRTLSPSSLRLSSSFL